HPDVGWVQRSSDAQRLRGAGRLRIRTDAARRGAGESEAASAAGGKAVSSTVLGDKAETPAAAPVISGPEGAGQPNYALTPKTTATGEFEGDLLEVAMGPQHPSTHGVFRMDVVLDGERVVKLKPVFGYLHRN